MCKKIEKILWSRFQIILPQNQHFIQEICPETHFDGYYWQRQVSKNAWNLFLINYTNMCIYSNWMEMF